MKKNLIYLLTLVSVFTFSCKDDHDHDKDGHDHDHENELITTLRVSLTDTATGSVQTFTWRQPGGPGTAVTIDTIRLASGKFYNATTDVLDESKNPVKSVTAEIEELKNEHRFIYTSSTSRLTTTITDFDSNNPPLELGLRWNAVTSQSGDQAGQLRITLKHYSASNPKTNGPQAGSTDIDVTFPVIIN